LTERWLERENQIMPTFETTPGANLELFRLEMNTFKIELKTILLEAEARSLWRLLWFGLVCEWLLLLAAELIVLSIKK
jgi:hypothetical protein